MSIYTKDEFETWCLARALFIKQRNAILAGYPDNVRPLAWRELRMELRIMWWELARKEESVHKLPDPLPPRRRFATLRGL